jgi:deferrochelatase/peroxidase EfeB
LTLACKDRKIELCDQKHYDDEKYLAPEHLAAMFVGRWKSGAPLAEYPHFDPVSPEMSNHNDFMYRHESNIDPHPFDPKGKVTPVFAHIRIANSRDDDIRGGIGSPAENRSENDLHRILRRGIPYGPQWAKDLETKTVHRRGMLFLCFQRDIEQQFEYVQNRWWNTDHKYKELEHKCIIDLLDEASVKKFHMGLERWVDTKGGGYFFSPSITALQNLEQYVVYP